MGHTIPRILALDMLPAIVPSYAELFIKSVNMVEVSWTVYLNPMSTNLWFMLVCVAVLTAIVLSGIEKLMPLSRLRLKTWSFLAFPVELRQQSLEHNLFEN